LGFRLQQSLGNVVPLGADPVVVLAHSTDKLDLLLTDIALPRVEGLALAKRLRADQRDLPVLFMTGDDGHEDLASEHVLMKPFTGADLLRAFGRRIQSARHSETPLADCFAA
jgi:CheY-like chemotaxis protein